MIRVMKTMNAMQLGIKAMQVTTKPESNFFEFVTWSPETQLKVLDDSY